jgi:hypothetical protein
MIYPLNITYKVMGFRVTASHTPGQENSIRQRFASIRKSFRLVEVKPSYFRIGKKFVNSVMPIMLIHIAFEIALLPQQRGLIFDIGSKLHKCSHDLDVHFNCRFSLQYT